MEMRKILHTTGNRRHSHNFTALVTGQLDIQGKQGILM